MGSEDFDYDRAFGRNLGLVSADEQRRLRGSRVAVVGAGGVGGSHAVTLARMGIGHFRVIDPDTFGVSNFNRQLGACVSTLGENKAKVIERAILDINPTAEVRSYEAYLGPDNIAGFLEGVDIVADGLDFFAIDARITMGQACAERGIPIVTSGPLGMSATMHTFIPGVMDLPTYFDVGLDTPKLDKIVAFLVGLTPRFSQRTYMDMRHTNPVEQYGPSLAAACMMCSGVLSVEVLRLLLGRPGARPAPYYYQFDAYRRRFYSGYLRGGNRHPVQRLKRWVAKRVLTRIVPDADKLTLANG